MAGSLRIRRCFQAERVRTVTVEQRCVPLGALQVSLRLSPESNRDPPTAIRKSHCPSWSALAFGRMAHAFSL